MVNPLNEKELKEHLDKKLGKTGLLEGVWEELVELGYDRSALESAEGLRDAVHRARRLTKLARGAKNLRPRRTGKPPDIESLITEAEWHRGQTLAKELARRAAQFHGVRQVREKLFPGGLPTPDQARALFECMAPRVCSIDFFTGYKIPLIGHSSYFNDPNYPPDKQPVSMTETMEILVEWPGGQRRVPYSFESHVSLRSKPELGILRGTEHVARGSAFWDLYEASERLANHYDWSQEEATWFIVTGICPAVQPVYVKPKGGWRHDHNHLRLVIEVEPWVSAGSLLNVYRHMQRLVFGRQGRPMSAQNLDVFDHVSEQMNQAAGALTWAELMKGWNRSGRGKPYSELRRFSRDVRRTSVQLMFPKVEWPSDRPPATEDDASAKPKNAKRTQRARGRKAKAVRPKRPRRLPRA